VTPPIRVVTAAEAARDDASTIEGGVPSRALMQRAGAAVASEITHHFAPRLRDGALVLCGSGNNGGDGWVIARALAAIGVRVAVREVSAARTEDAIAERASAIPHVEIVPHESLNGLGGSGVIVDALLGTGSRGAPRGEIADAISLINNWGSTGAAVVAVDIPSGLDPDSGVDDGSVRAVLTVTFGSVKRGLLVARASAGRIVAVDIGLAPTSDAKLMLVEDRWAAMHVPPIDAAAHKGTRGRIAIVGGAAGMAGATVLAARAAYRSGAGMVKLVVAAESLEAVQRSEPTATAVAWPASSSDVTAITDWADAIVIGPGLGAGAGARALLHQLLGSWNGPVVLDADGLNAFAGDPAGLASLLRGKRAVITPHPVELARLTGQDVDEVLRRRFEIGAELADELGITVLLKGVPTVISSPGSPSLVSASGTPALATAGSGDVLAGMVATMLAQLRGSVAEAAAVAAHHHGVAAQLASRGRDGSLRTRGVTLDDVISAIPATWAIGGTPFRYPVLVDLPRVGD
jgi:ADP-dependent NAD(P)H-hydrate dehydratase / NAD(P)H-hydrate epimerase